MNEANELNQELIPGTSIPRPRAREIAESDQEYVEYLKTYYEKYFPETQPEQVVTPVVEENINQQAEISNDELDDIYEKLEKYADDIIKEEGIVSKTEAIEEEEPLFDINVQEESKNDDFVFDTKVNEEVSDDIEIKFDTTVSSEEIISFTPSNETLTSKIRTPHIFKKVVEFFNEKKTQIASLTTRVNNYFEDISTTLEKDDLIPATGRLR